MQWGSQTRDFRADSSFKTTVKTHFSSLSSRNVSFFCFLISSKLRRASARSLTARSLSRRRLSHRVLQKGEKGDCEQLVYWRGRSTTDPLSFAKSLLKTHKRTDLMLSLSATILSLSWKAQSLRHLATSASCVASFSSWDIASYCFLSISISLLARSMSKVAESCF